MAVVSLFTVPPCRTVTHRVDDGHGGRHRVLTCSCGWEIWTLTDRNRDDIYICKVESEVHRQVAAEFGWDHPRGRIITWVR